MAGKFIYNWNYVVVDIHQRLKVIEWLLISINVWKWFSGWSEWMVDISFVNMKLFCFNGLSFIEIDPGLVESFMNAAKKGEASKVVQMVEVGMPVDITDEYGLTALIAAASYNQTNVVRCLLYKGADVNKQTGSGWTALHEASIENRTGVMRMLLQRGARKDIKDELGNTPIDHARLENRKEALDLLEQY